MATAARAAMREGNPAEKKQEPRLSIGRLEIQIIQENTTPVGEGQHAGRETLPEHWEQMDRQYIRHLSLS